ncbi:hypothetical protein CYMTET_56435 [Cymbomonas tetramitiformis]|uniref:Histone-lysine N-methyltransferase, H3 lysine-79 specific n=1 Tax=Cymbomonas tetramitiformis TaxID=36881 RepID=A0AAE0ELU3_9CHLO|nr:hypothetical protein CYMTET_56435 [Cymbomonas tetramitiformis]
MRKGSEGRVMWRIIEPASAAEVCDWLADAYECVDYSAALEKAQNYSEVEDFSSDEFIYGEFDTGFFLDLLEHLSPSPTATFADLGSGRGQIVLTAAAVRTWKRCIGVEIVPILHELALGAYEVVCAINPPRALSECVFLHGRMEGLLADLAHVDVVFAYATKFPLDENGYLSISRILHSALKEGATVVTVNNVLDLEAGFSLETEITGPNPETNGLTNSTAYIWRVC